MLDLIDTKGKKDIKSMTLEEVTAQMTALGEKSFRAKQLYDWLHVKLAESFDDMSTLSKDLRQKLKENYSLTALQTAGERISAIDGTRKYPVSYTHLDSRSVSQSFRADAPPFNRYV